MAKAKAPAKRTSSNTYSLELDKRRGRILLNMLGAIELRMFEKGFRPTEAQLKTIAEMRKNLSQQIHGEPDTSLEEQLAVAVQWTKKA